MSTVEYNLDLEGLQCPSPAFPQEPGRKSLHRIREVRRQQGVSTRSVARKMGVSMQESRVQEDPAADLRITQLMAWQRALEVPLADLLVDSEGSLSAPVSQRARLLRVMKTAKSIQESAKEPGMQRLTTMLIEQLCEVMPELRDVSPWHSVGQRRTQDEMGRIAECPIPDSFFGDS